ncbi:hypothetical protein [Streptomyces sp. AC512_CC834]|uniref:hypothetical protein n=1 Tax=Streptomyces sp. AC512_CC834 TaxID=2823691 RepID=UPI001C275E0A|nr:hypothetical protein [Streptomyces sp. AC512_CC834]
MSADENGRDDRSCRVRAASAASGRRAARTGEASWPGRRAPPGASEPLQAQMAAVLEVRHGEIAADTGCGHGCGGRP